MDSDEQFDQLARRDTELSKLAARGRRRTMAIMVLVCLPSPFIVMKLNHDSSLVSLIPIWISVVGGLSYSWAKWRRRPEDSQSVAFVGLDRTRRGATYRSMWRGTAIEDPVVLTIVESIDDHLRRSVWPVIAAVAAVAAMTIALVAGGGGGAVALPASIVVGLIAAAVIAVHRWLMNRVGLVLDRGGPIS
jgi:hypothetical protein